MALRIRLPFGFTTAKPQKLVILSEDLDFYIILQRRNVWKVHFKIIGKFERAQILVINGGGSLKYLVKYIY